MWFLNPSISETIGETINNAVANVAEQLVPHPKSL
jgi:hypothetical protein